MDDVMIDISDLTTALIIQVIDEIDRILEELGGYLDRALF